MVKGDFDKSGSGVSLPVTPPPVLLLPLEDEEGAIEDRRRLPGSGTPREAGAALEQPGLGTGVVTGLSRLSASTAESSLLGPGVPCGVEKDSITSVMNKNWSKECLAARRTRGDKHSGVEKGEGICVVRFGEHAYNSAFPSTVKLSFDASQMVVKQLAR